MRKAIHYVRNISLIITGLEIILLVLGFVFYSLNLYGVADYVSGEYIVVAAAILVVINFVVYWMCVTSLEKARLRNDLETATLVGSDVQEAYAFGKIGLIVVDESNVILWTNNLFKELKVDLIDTPIGHLSKNLDSMTKGSAATAEDKVTFKDRIYAVKYISSPRLFIFHDITAYENALSYNKEQGLCLGVINIDNYDDRAGDEEDANDTLAKVRATIADYFREKNVLLRRVSADSYFAVCNYKSLQSMKKDCFAVLEKVRSIQVGPEAPFTLSIGFAHGFPDSIRLNEMVTNALDVALSRGGDQVCVSTYGAELEFFGGKTVTQETTSRVKVRTFADAFLKLVSDASEVYVMGHAEMDMDALGACLGVRAICEYAQKSCHIVYSPKLAERKTRIAFQEAFSKDAYDALTIDPDEALASIKKNTLLVVVDVSRPSMVLSRAVLQKASKVIVIDHHRRAEEYIDSPIAALVDPSASSASEILVEMIRYATANPRIEIRQSYATLMLSGIFLDTNFFKNKTTGMKAFEAAEILKSYGADNSLADDYLKDEYEEYSLITKIISTMETPYYGVVYCVSDEKDIVERSTLAKVANQVMQLKGINAVFVIGKTEEKLIRLSARSDGSINVQLLCEKMGGGGHFSSAAAVFIGQPLSKVIATFKETLDEFLDTARNDNRKEGENK